MSLLSLPWSSNSHSHVQWGRNLVLSLRTKATVLCFEWLSQRWGSHCEPSCHLGDGSGWVGFFFFNGNRGCVWSVGNRLWEEYNVFFYRRAWFLYFLYLSFLEKHSWFLVCVYFGIEPTVPDWVFCHFAHTAPCLTTPVSFLSNRMQKNHRVWWWKFQQANGTVA